MQNAGAYRKNCRYTGIWIKPRALGPYELWEEEKDKGGKRSFQPQKICNLEP